MSELENSTPAGAEPNVTSTPVDTTPEPARQESYSLEEAAQKWEAAQEPPPAQSEKEAEPAAKAAPEGEQADATTEATDNDNGDPVEAGETNAPETDDAPLEFESLHGNTKLRLRDGSEVTVGDLKKRWGDLSELEKRQQQFEGFVQSKMPELQALSHQKAQLAQREQYLSQHLEPALQILQQQQPVVPAFPPEELMEQDFMQYQREVRAYEQGRINYDKWYYQQEALKTEIHQRREQQAQQESQRAQQEKEQRNAAMAQQRDILLSKRKDLADPQKAAAFGKLLTETGAKYGFSEQEVRGEEDARLLHMVADLAEKASKWDALQNNLPKPVKAQTTGTAQVAAPGRRVPAAEAAGGDRKELLARASSKPGGLSLDDAAALAMKLGF